MPARHRLDGPPTTALSDVHDAVSELVPQIGHRAGAVAASSGLVVSLFAVPAAAAPSSNGAHVHSVDSSVLVASARELLAAAPIVSAPATATFTIDAPVVTAVAPPPPAPVVAQPQASPQIEEDEAVGAEQDVQESVSVEEPIGAPAPASASGNAIVEIAASLVGTPYVWGGTTPAGFDCSGFTSYVYTQVGISLPRTSSEQRYAGTVVPRDQAQPGDLIWTPGHIAIYAGGNQQVDAPVPGKTIQIRDIWQANPTFIRVG
ncbi:C40 family peptidase [Cellulomonas sp. 179-A 9B4 NHS]|uniref:C40 family peptidase n=1 Tax=Cellulomonas sp. 179-A 9B4 NHS TaxID=3142379 RepID=UPI0039A2D1EB